MANTDKKPEDNKQISALDKLSKKILSTIDTSYTERNILSKKDAQFQSIINREFDISKGVSGGNVVDFIAALRPDKRSGTVNPLTVDSSDNVFTQNIADIFGYFQDIYKNKYLEMSDLKFISKFIPSIGEAVKTTLDSVVSSDDISNTITRTINLSSALSQDERDQIMQEVERLEKNYHLPKKLKNVVYKKTLVTGSFFVYAIPYKDLFKEYNDIKQNGGLNHYFDGSGMVSKTIKKKGSNKDFNLNNPAKEASINDDFSSDISIDVTDAICTEANTRITNMLTSELGNSKKGDIEKVTESVRDAFPNIIIDKSEILYDAMESANSMDSYRKSFSNNEELKNSSYIPDGTISTGGGSSAAFDTINGTYIKYIDSKNIIPIKIFDTVVGYYHILPTPRKKSTKTGNSGMMSMTSTMFNAVNLTEQKKEAAINDIVQTIADGIMNKFSYKFVEKNGEFKNLIAECIIANGLVQNDYRIQFIPAQYIIPFIVNEDENGNGESILADSLFPAKLLLSLIICKLLNYMNKSGNKTIAHVYKGPIDVNSSNQLQRVTRQLQESNITFNDLLSTNLVFSKFTRDSNIQLPRAKNGDKLVEFETQEGQNIDLKTDFEDKLEQMAILGTGVPSVIMEYVNQADFAKQIVSANIKFAGRVSSLQTDLEDSTTQLYRILIENSQLEKELKTKALSSFAYKLPRPKVLANSNNSEFLQTLLGVAQTITGLYVGESTNDDPNIAKIKDIMIRETVKKNSPFFDWNSTDESFEKAKLQCAKEAEESKKKSASGGEPPDTDF